MVGVFAIIFTVQAIASVQSSAARYPSGLNPALCPNYPHCDNALLAAYAQPSASGTRDYYSNDDGQYDGGADGHYSSGYQRHYPSAGLYNQGHHQHSATAAAVYTEPGYPAGLSSSNCPNYPYCSHQVPAEALRYSGGPPAKRYPAGITPHNCPNYPYCY